VTTAVPTLAVGIAGTGYAAGLHARALRSLPGVRVAAAADTDGERLARFGAEHGVEALVPPEALAAWPGLDAVLVCTPPAAHAAMAGAALRARRHVLVEKPLAESRAEARALRAAADRAGRVLQVGHVTRFDPELLALAGLVRSGALGRVVRVRVVSVGPLLPDGWRADPAHATGGVLTDLGSHALDALRLVLGGTRVRRVYAAARSTRARCAVEDTVTATLELGGGIVATLEAGFGVSAAAGGSPATLELFGTHGWARNRPFQAADARGAPLDVAAPSTPADLDGYLFRAQAEHFAACCRGQAECRAGGGEGEAVVVLLEALYRSARTGRPVCPRGPKFMSRLPPTRSRSEEAACGC
jgi:predicted dehydrogenase